MATATDNAVRPAFAGRFVALAGPVAAMTAVWLTSAGHTTNFREMNAARGWVTSIGYGLHSAYLFSIGLSILAAPMLLRRFASYSLTLAGLALLCGGSLLNGLDLYAPYEVAVAGRVLAGLGGGVVLCAAPRLLPRSNATAFEWLGIVIPAFGLPVIGGASFLYGWSSWEGGFLFEGILALIGLACVVPVDPPSEPPVPEFCPLWYWPALAASVGCTWYVLHWGHLSGWAGDRVVLLVGFAGAVGLVAALWLAWPGLDAGVMREGSLRWFLVGYAGLVQFFNVSESGTYGGLFVNLSDWQRALLIWPLGLGAAAAFAVGRLAWLVRPPGRGGAVAGLLVLAAGMGLGHATVLGWPFWDVLNTVEFRWFAAPQTWELAPARFLMGFGSGFVILSETRRASADPARESRIRPGLQAAQFFGGGIGIGILATALLMGHQWEYSYAADRGAIQAEEITERTALLREAYATGGAADAPRRSEVLMFRSVNYQADVLVFADLYALFGVTSVTLATGVAAGIAWDRFRSC